MEYHQTQDVFSKTKAHKIRFTCYSENKPNAKYRNSYCKQKEKLETKYNTKLKHSETKMVIMIKIVILFTFTYRYIPAYGKSWRKVCVFLFSFELLRRVSFESLSCSYISTADSSDTKNNRCSKISTDHTSLSQPTHNRKLTQTYCGCPKVCTQAVWDTLACDDNFGGCYTCGGRISYVESLNGGNIEKAHAYSIK